jgi:hypothetical protein
MGDGNQNGPLDSTWVIELQDPSGPACVLARSARLPLPEGQIPRMPACDDVISAELASACELPDAPDAMTGLTPEKQKVLSWLRVNQELIVQAEADWLVDRRAIAGAIAWEALNNVKSGRVFRRWEGPGKIHYFDIGAPVKGAIPNAMAWLMGSHKVTTAEMTEAAGYLPPKTEQERGTAVKTAAGSITYIAAIMRADADVVSRLGGYPEELTYWNPPVLATWFNTKTLDELKAIYSKKRYPAPLDPGEKMGPWVRDNLAYLEAAVGVLPKSCRPAVSLHPVPNAKIPEAK